MIQEIISTTFGLGKILKENTLSTKPKEKLINFPT